MLKAKIVLISALVSCALVSGCKDDKKSSVAIEFCTLLLSRSGRRSLQN